VVVVVEVVFVGVLVMVYSPLLELRVLFTLFLVIILLLISFDVRVSLFQKISTLTVVITTRKSPSFTPSLSSSSVLVVAFPLNTIFCDYTSKPF
jgi:hypothetical protein